MSEAARRRTRPEETRRAGEPARRTTDVAADTATRGLRDPLEVRSAPPSPSRVERDRAASARASRETPFVPRADSRTTQSGPHPIPAPPERTPTPAPAPRPQRQPSPFAQPGRASSSPDLIPPEDDARTVLTAAVAPDPNVGKSDGSDAEWSAKAAAPPAIDPEDWTTDAIEVLEATRRPTTIPPPTPPRRITAGQPALSRSSSPPPTRVAQHTEIFQPPAIEPVPEVPENGLVNAARYAVSFARARWQRRGAIKALSAEIKDETVELDGVLGALGKEARSVGVDNRVLSAENAAIDAAHARRQGFEHECAALNAKQADENSKFGDLERERQAKLDEVEAALEEAQRELGALEAQRRSLRDKRKSLEDRQRAYLKGADDRDEQAGRASMGDARSGLRRAAEDLRRDAAALDPERQDLDRRLSALEKPMSTAAAKVEALKAEHESARRSLHDAREGHRHRLAELEAEQGRKGRELSQAEAEIQRRLVTLGTLVNLHRIERPEFEDMYARIDGLRSAIGARSTEIDKLTAEREAYDKASLVRGGLALGGGLVAFLTLIVILLWVL
ncbi:MAG TPA: hypothetical protein VML75_09935 [Kofleriaceae bacterium]|nr:hypothetical protein [Kofleriaceae bacterium]